MKMRRFLGAIGVMLTVSACAGSDGLRQLNTPDNGPDEFNIVPNKPLETPDSYTSLPAPTPGQTNLTELTPKADAVEALGGNPRALLPTDDVPSRDAALVTQASRYGVTADIRSVLAEADAEFRRRRGRLTGLRIVKVDRYSEVYEGQALDPFAEAARFRKLGLPTPASPPSNP